MTSDYSEISPRLSDIGKYCTLQSLPKVFLVVQGRSKGAAPQAPTPTTPGEGPPESPGAGAGGAGGAAARRREFV